MTTQKNYLNATEASGFLGISKSHLYKFTSEKRIKFFKPNGRKIYFRLSDLENYILAGEIKTTEEEKEGVSR